ncbi:MAG: hypothetical protein ACKOWK_02945 [Micrococcales bacterium]
MELATNRKFRAFTAAVITIATSLAVVLVGPPAARADMGYCANDVSSAGTVTQTQHCIASIHTDQGYAHVLGVTTEPNSGLTIATYYTDAGGTFQLLYLGSSGVEVLAVDASGLPKGMGFEITITGRAMPLASVGVGERAMVRGTSTTTVISAAATTISTGQISGTASTTNGFSLVMVDSAVASSLVPQGKCLDDITAADRSIFMFSNSPKMLYSLSGGFTDGTLGLDLPAQLSPTDVVDLTVPKELFLDPACGWNLDPNLDVASQLKTSIDAAVGTSGAIALTVSEYPAGYYDLHLTPTPMLGSTLITASHLTLSHVDLTQGTVLNSRVASKLKVGKATALPSVSSGQAVTWTSQTPKICTVTSKASKGYPKGKLTGKKAGSCVITASAPGVTGSYYPFNASFTVKVTR